MKLFSFIFAISVIHVTAFANVSKTLTQEWKSIKSRVDNVSVDGDIGGYMEYHELGDGLTLLWRLVDKDHQVIRLFKEKENDKYFAVTYYRTNIIVDGTVVLRRSIETSHSTFINHTVNLNSNDYLGSQGYFPYDISEDDIKLMKDMGISPHLMP